MSKGRGKSILTRKNRVWRIYHELALLGGRAKVYKVFNSYIAGKQKWGTGLQFGNWPLLEKVDALLFEFGRHLTKAVKRE